jgi:hypothetical protein
MWYIYYKSNKREWSINAHINMDRSHRHNNAWFHLNETQKKVQLLPDDRSQNSGYSQ